MDTTHRDERSHLQPWPPPAAPGGSKRALMVSLAALALAAPTPPCVAPTLAALALTTTTLAAPALAKPRKRPKRRPAPPPDRGPFDPADTAWAGRLDADPADAAAAADAFDVRGGFSLRVDAMGRHAAGSLSGRVPGGLFSCALKAEVDGVEVRARCGRGDAGGVAASRGTHGVLTLQLARQGARGVFVGTLHGKPLRLLAVGARKATLR